MSKGDKAGLRFLEYFLLDDLERAAPEFELLILSQSLLAFIKTIGRGRNDSVDDPQAVFGDALPRILQTGFVGEPTEILGLAMRNITCLSTLRALIYAERSAYWMSKIEPIDPESPKDRTD